MTFLQRPFWQMLSYCSGMLHKARYRVQYLRTSGWISTLIWCSNGPLIFLLFDLKKMQIIIVLFCLKNTPRCLSITPKSRSKASRGFNVTNEYWSKVIHYCKLCCGSVGRAVASNSRGPWFKIHWSGKIYIEHLLSTVLKKRKLRKKRPGMAHKKQYCKLNKSNLRMYLHLKSYNCASKCFCYTNFQICNSCHWTRRSRVRI